MERADTSALLRTLRGASPAALNSQVAEVLARLDGSPAYDVSRIAEARREMRRVNELLRGPIEPVHTVVETSIPGRRGSIRARVYRPADARATIVFLHGGGWVMGDLEVYDALCRRLANESGCEVVSIDYRLAPETPLPGPLEDCLDAIHWLAEHRSGVPLVVMGDSAGGNLAALCALEARDSGGPALVLQVLVYPVTRSETDTESFVEHDGGKLFLEMRDLYLAGADPCQPGYAPLCAEDLSRLSPAILVVSELDILRDDGLSYALALRAAEVPVCLHFYGDMPHGFLHRVDAYARAREALTRLSLAIRAAVSGETLPFGDF